MPSTWLIRLASSDYTPTQLGVSVIGGNFQAAGPSSVRLRAGVNFDATELVSYGGSVTIKKDGDAFFVGKCRAVPKSADDKTEGQDYLVEDAWADLERITYQESWAVNGGSVLMPRVFLGVDDAGTRITLGEQIEAALDFAIAGGVSLIKGSIPTGMLLWPQEVDGMSCAEVIRECLKFHPDWIPWIDHSTTPNPTFNVTPRASASALSVACTACSSFQVTEIQDQLPDVVRICFVTADEIDGEIYRSVSVQKYPTGGADSGAGVLCTTVDLQGVRAQIQKQQVQTRTIPSSADKAFLKLNFPALTKVADADFTVSAWATEVIAETETPPDPINPNATRLGGPAATITLSDLPRQLVKGSIHEWMRKKVGRVRITYTIAATGTADAADEEIIARIPQDITITGTNATTKVYKSLASWEAAENAPAGIAESYYTSIHNGTRYQGGISILAENLSGAWHGRKLNLTGGVSGWSSMAAPVHSVSWDAESEIVNIDFGPIPELSFGDYLEYLRYLNRREVNWITSAERASDQFGDDAGASATGENIGPFDGPKEWDHYDKAPDHPWKVTANGDATVAVGAGRLITHRTNGTGDLGDPASLVGYFLDFTGDSSVTVTANGYIYALCDITTIVTGDDVLSGGSGARFYSERQVFTGTPEVVFSTVAPASLDPYADHGRNFAILLATVTYASSIATVGTQYVKTDIPPVGGSYCYEATP
jgi:hypothetical protein